MCYIHHLPQKKKNSLPGQEVSGGRLIKHARMALAGEQGFVLCVKADYLHWASLMA